jgi:uncharacterized integral membrane protein
MAEAIRRFAFWVLLIPASLFLIIFALANRQRVLLSLFPFDGGLDLPLFLIFFLSVLFGAFLGGFITWNSQRSWRQLSRRQAKEIDELRDELSALKSVSSDLRPRQDWQILPPL